MSLRTAPFVALTATCLALPAFGSEESKTWGPARKQRSL